MDNHKGICTIEDCNKPVRSIGFCRMHYERNRKWGNPFTVKRSGGGRVLWVGKICKVDGCDRQVRYIGLCNMHCNRFYRSGELGPPKSLRDGTGSIGKNGYRYISVNKHRWLEHRYVMTQILGRTLLKNESVHHKNGIRTDNRPGNLELWCSSQPSGQRVKDLVVWAKEILTLYDKENSCSQ